MVAAGVMAGVAVASEPAIVVVDNDGIRQEIALSNLDRLTFGASQVSVQTRDNQEPLQYAYSSVDRILLNESMSALPSVASDGSVTVWPTVISSTVNIAGVPEGAIVNVYGADGSAAASASATDGTLTIDLSDIPQGVYIVSVGSQSVKILKK